MPPSGAFVFFGATGDLARKKVLPALLALTRSGHLKMPVIGVARSDWSDDRFREHARQAIAPTSAADRAAFDTLAANMRFVAGDYADDAIYPKLQNALGGAMRPLHYLAIPPDLFSTVIRGLTKAGCAKSARVVVEKPFGRDLASARALNAVLHSAFEENAIFRIDHA